MTFNKASHKLALAVAGAFVVVGWGCSSFDDEFGVGLTPSSQDMKVCTLDSNNLTNTDAFSTTLYKSDSVRSSNIGLGILGAERRKAFGERRAGFFSQFVPVNELNEDDDDDWSSAHPFGYNPIFDSIVLIVMLKEYSGDTLIPQKFEVYEAENVDFLKSSMDSVYFDDFNTDLLNLTPEPLFTFTYPDYDREVYVHSSSVRLYPAGTIDNNNPQGNATDFINRLMLKDDSPNYKMYNQDNRKTFLSKFKGIYIKPADSNIPATPSSFLEPQGAVYSFFIDGAGLGLYGRSFYGVDIPIIKDTIDMAYCFRNLSAYSLENDYYGININTIERTNEEYTLDVDVETMLVEGMGGVVGGITLEEQMFREIYDALQTTTDNSGEGRYNTIFVNEARLSLYLTQEGGGDYNSSLLDPIVVSEWMDDMPKRLGMYTSYVDYYKDYDDYDDDISMLTGVEDYYYNYELSYSVVLPYNGYMNRSFGCYNMVISSQFQEAWNSYLEAVEKAKGDPDAIDFEDVENRTFYVAPVADNLYTLKQAQMQGANVNGNNNAPIRMRLTYTMIKK